MELANIFMAMFGSEAIEFNPHTGKAINDACYEILLQYNRVGNNISILAGHLSSQRNI